MKQQGKFTGSPQTKILGNHQFKTKSASWLTLIYIHHCSWCPRGTGAHPEPWRKKKTAGISHPKSRVSWNTSQIFAPLPRTLLDPGFPHQKKKRALQHSDIDMESQWFSRENDLQCWCVHIYLNLLGSRWSLPHVLADVVHQPHPKNSKPQSEANKAPILQNILKLTTAQLLQLHPCHLEVFEEGRLVVGVLFHILLKVQIWRKKVKNPIRILMNIKIAKRAWIYARSFPLNMILRCIVAFDPQSHSGAPACGNLRWL